MITTNDTNPFSVAPVGIVVNARCFQLAPGNPVEIIGARSCPAGVDTSEISRRFRIVESRELPVEIGTTSPVPRPFTATFDVAKLG
jgi:hypothetical protein